MENLVIKNVSENNRKTYRRIRKAIGYLGIFLPIILIILSTIPFFKTSIQPSISFYYYTNLREIFTGSLCAVGLFLICYVGFKGSPFWKNDHLLTNIAGFMAFGIAFFPTNPELWTNKLYTLIPINLKFLGHIHYGFACIFFLILAILCVKVFTIGQNTNEKTIQSIFNENNIYKICGYLILVFMFLIPIFSYLNVFASSTLVFETVMLLSFGISWLIKGRALGDKGKIGEILYRELN